MRPLRLDLDGFAVFRNPTTIDLTEVDFFVLVGPTGSGKSTVLDAICFALYGTVPRWGDRRRVDHALAPSATQAKVRLVFEVGGTRYVATRVVRRDGKGKVATTHAGLERLPPGATVGAAEPGTAALGTVLAGTPAEMEAAVLTAVGLPYEQFTSCVVLPQGEFARFLHAKPAERQEILVNLLGLHVYERVGERAGALHKAAETRAATLRGQLDKLAGADDAALATAEAAVRQADTLVEDVRAALPALDAARAAGEAARADLRRVEAEITHLRSVRVPATVAGLATTLASAAEAATAAQAQVHLAEEREEKARAELAAAGDRAALTRLADAHAQRARHATRVGDLATTLATATADHAAATTAADAARVALDRAAQSVATATHAVETAQAADVAASLRVHLVAGEACPVCEQPVATVPARRAPALKAARDKQAKAEQAHRSAATAAQQAEHALRGVERRLDAATAQHAESAQQLSQLDEVLRAAAPLTAVQARLDAIGAAEAVTAQATQAVKAARVALRQADAALKAAQDQVTAAWRDFDTTRDRLAVLGPPGVDRDHLARSWHDLARWAGEAVQARSLGRDEIVARAEAALATLATATAALDDLFSSAGVTVSGGDHRQSAALAVERARAALHRVLERRAEAAALRAQVEEHEQAARVAKALALHLHSDRFERWLLTEALDSLVDGASRILRELSSGHYDLAHDKGEFSVIDHADAGLRRPVRTLSGGETFQASLALALALSEQLAGLSTTSTSLESIMLDEGFGTLDAQTLDTVAATLENLAARGDRMVGVVTHVPALAERIPVRFELSRDVSGAAQVTRAE